MIDVDDKMMLNKMDIDSGQGGLLVVQKQMGGGSGRNGGDPESKWMMLTGTSQKNNAKSHHQNGRHQKSDVHGQVEMERFLLRIGTAT